MVEVFLIFVLGVGVGSFLNVLIDRLPRDESFLIGRSYCESCKKTLRWYDLIPLLSFISLKARCRYCRVPLSYYYPLVELVTGIMFVSAIIFTQSFASEESFFHLRGVAEPGTVRYLAERLLGGESLGLVFYLFIFSSFIVVFFADLKYGIIPDKITYSAVIVSILYIILNTNYLILSLVSALGSFLFFLLIFLATRGRGMGFGDVKLAFLIGLILGFPKTVVALYVAFLTGAVISIILILGKKKKFKGSTIPFGPFLVIGTFIALFWGEVILQKVFPFLLQGR
ncbi:MAG: prepilin peptidase [Patescibacteria group bacterium]